MLEDVASMLVDPVRHSIPVPKLIRTRYGIVVIGTETTAMASEVLNCDINNIRVAGCIHIDSLNLSLKYSTYTTITATNCDSYSWAISGQTYTASGTYIKDRKSVV